MDVSSSLVAAINKVLEDVVYGPIADENGHITMTEATMDKFRNPW